MSGKIKLTKEKREDMIALIKAYFIKERDEEIGDLASGFMLDFIMEKLAPEFYNQGIRDSYTYMTAKIEDLLEIEMQ